MKYVFGAAVAGVLLILGLSHLRIGLTAEPAVRAEDAPGKNALAEIQKMEADIKRLQEVAPDQAHAMMSAAYNFSNLSFAGLRHFGLNWSM